MNEENRNDLQEILTHALNELKNELGEKFNIDKINLAELERRTGISRGRLRGLKANDFIVKPHGLCGKTSNNNIIDCYSGILDNLLSRGVSNASVCYDRIKEHGYSGSKSAVKNYIKNHKQLIPAKRQLVSPQGNRGRRYETGPGESYQMDWEFVTVESEAGKTYKIACFAMICHHCGQRYIEFFPNAKQENLFIGMIHAFMYMGVPKYVLTDNMKCVVIKRDLAGKPIWQKDYELFMGNIGFETKLCKPRHPFTKGAVERLVRFTKNNFLAGRIFTELTDLNYDAIRWCNNQNEIYHRAVDCIPNVIFVVEGGRAETGGTELRLLKKIFTDILNYEVQELRRGSEEFIGYGINHQFRVFALNLPKNQLTQLTEDSLDQLFSRLKEEFDVKPEDCPIFYLYDRDVLSYHRNELRGKYVKKYTDPYGTDNGDQGQLLLSYPAIESFLLSCIKDDIAKESSQAVTLHYIGIEESGNTESVGRFLFVLIITL